MTKRKLKPMSPIMQAIRTIDQTIRALKLKCQELVALLPIEPSRKKVDTIVINPMTGKKYDYVECGKSYAEKHKRRLQRKKNDRQ